MSILNTIYYKKEGIVVTPMEDYFLIFRSHTDEVNTPYLCKLNQTSYFILNCLDGERTVSDVVDILAQKFNESREVVQNDLIELLVNFESKRIVSKRM